MHNKRLSAHTFTMESQGLLKERTIEFLKFLHQNAAMGRHTLRRVTDEMSESNLKTELLEQIKGYDEIGLELSRRLAELGSEPDDICKMTKKCAAIMIKMQVGEETSVRKIAKMVIEGNTKGVIEATEKLNCFEDLDSSDREVAKRYLDMVEKNTNSLKRFL